VAENDHPPLTWHIALTTVYGLTIHGDKTGLWRTKNSNCSK